MTLNDLLFFTFVHDRFLLSVPQQMMQGSLSVEHKPFIGNGILSAGPMKKFNVRVHHNVVAIIILPS
jgi:hypothetical protein